MNRLAVIALAVAASSTASAGGFSLSEQTSVAGGSGGASTAREGDAGAAWYNPAALTDGGGIRVGLSVMAAFATVSAEGMDPSTSQPFQADTEGGARTPASVQLSYADGPWAAGVSVGVPFASGVEWPAMWPGRHEIQSSQILVVRAAPFFAWRLSNRVAVSGGVHVDMARMQIGRDLDFVAEQGDVAIDMDGWGIGGHASVHVTATPQLALAASYKSRTVLTLTGGADFDAPLAFTAKTMDQRTQTELTLPDRIALGSRYALGKLAVLADAELTLWGVYDELVVDFERGETPDVVRTNDWSTGFALRAGGEYAVLPSTTARAGAFFDRSPVPTDTLAPSSPDSHRLGFTLGGSHQLGDVHVDAFYEYLHILGRASESDDSLDARYSGRAHFLGLGLRWQPAR